MWRHASLCGQHWESRERRDWTLVGIGSSPILHHTASRGNDDTREHCGAAPPPHPFGAAAVGRRPILPIADRPASCARELWKAVTGDTRRSCAWTCIRRVDRTSQRDRRQSPTSIVASLGRGRARGLRPGPAGHSNVTEIHPLRQSRIRRKPTAGQMKMRELVRFKRQVAELAQACEQVAAYANSRRARAKLESLVGRKRGISNEGESSRDRGQLGSYNREARAFDGAWDSSAYCQIAGDLGRQLLQILAELEAVRRVAPPDRQPPQSPPGVRGTGRNSSGGGFRG
jgi:hypothetical protein